MEKILPKTRAPELRSKLQTLMFVRVLFVSVLLGAGLFVHVSDTPAYFGPIKNIHFLLLASVYFLTFIYVMMLRFSGAYVPLAYLQLLADALFVGLLVLVTGGVHSVFSLLFVLVIITASILLYRTGGVIMASTCAMIYCLAVVLQYWNVTKSLNLSAMFISPSLRIGVVYFTFVNVLAFFVMAFLTSYLSELVQKSRSELEAKKEDLHQLESLTEGIIISVNSGIIALDNMRSIVLFNPASEIIFGLSARDAVGKRLEEVLPWLSKSINSEGKTIIGDFAAPPAFKDLSLDTQAGQKTYLRYSLSPLRLSPKGAFGLIIVVQDITKIREIEEEMAKVRGLALVGELAAGIAHEIRNPMASISGSIQMLKEEMGQNKVKTRLVDIALKEVNRLNQMITDFLVFARPRDPSLEDFDLRVIIEETLQLFKHSPHWSPRIRARTVFNGPLPFRSDSQLIKQILWNLLRNAAEAMPSGGDLEIVCSISGKPKGQYHVRLKVKDTGPGIAEKDLALIFTPFFTTKEDGSGLGLAMVKRITDVLGGEVTGGNNPEGGAWFEVMIPSYPESTIGAKIQRPSH